MYTQGDKDFQKYLNELDKKSRKKLDSLFDQFCKGLIGIAAIKNYLAANKIGSFKDLGVDGTLRDRISKLLDDVYDLVRDNSEKAWDGAKQSHIKEVADSIKGFPVYHQYYAQHAPDTGSALREKWMMKKSRFNLSSRIWKTEMLGQIEAVIQVAFAERWSNTQVSQQLKKYLKEPDRLYRRIRDKHTGKLKLSKRAADYHPGRGVNRSSYKNMMRMILNERNLAYRRSAFFMMQIDDTITGQRISLSNNHTLNGKPFVDICDYAQGLYPKDFYWDGWHVNCRCIRTYVLMTRDEMSQKIKAIMRGESPSTIKIKMIDKIPVKFQEWSIQHAESIGRLSRLPNYIEYNEKYRDILLGAA